MRSRGCLSLAVAVRNTWAATLRWADISDELGPRLRMEVETETHSLRAA